MLFWHGFFQDFKFQCDFYGFNTVSLDQKGRLAIPAKYRTSFIKKNDLEDFLSVDRSLGLSVGRSVSRSGGCKMIGRSVEWKVGRSVSRSVGLSYKKADKLSLYGSYRNTCFINTPRHFIFFTCSDARCWWLWISSSFPAPNSPVVSGETFYFRVKQ